MRLCLDIILIQLKKLLIQFELRLANVIKLNFISFLTLRLFLSHFIHNFQLKLCWLLRFISSHINFFFLLLLHLHSFNCIIFNLQSHLKWRKKKKHSFNCIYCSVDFFHLFSCHFHFIFHKMPKRIYLVVVNTFKWLVIFIFTKNLWFLAIANVANQRCSIVM